jgi:hypothetical protein
MKLIAGQVLIGAVLPHLAASQLVLLATMSESYAKNKLTALS